MGKMGNLKIHKSEYNSICCRYEKGKSASSFSEAAKSTSPHLAGAVEFTQYFQEFFMNRISQFTKKDFLVGQTLYCKHQRCSALLHATVKKVGRKYVELSTTLGSYLLEIGTDSLYIKGFGSIGTVYADLEDYVSNQWEFYLKTRFSDWLSQDRYGWYCKLFPEKFTAIMDILEIDYQSFDEFKTSLIGNIEEK
jgi:hypothetical protein